MSNTGFFDWITTHEKIMMDTAVVGTGVAGLSIWATYEIMAQNFGYADAGAMTAMACCGTPIALVAGGYVIRRGIASGLHLPSLASLYALLQQRQATPTETPQPTESPNMDDWVNVINGLSRSRRPVLPIGRRQSGGLIGIDFNETPHLIINGQTGSGKTMNILRPLAASAAISGLFQVVILDKSGRNFRALEGHPNIHILRYDHNQLPQIARSIYAEIMRRDKWLADQAGNPTTIDRARADRRPPRILVIVDEFANASGLLKVQDRQLYGELTASMIQIAQEGRAMSVHLALVAQRPDATQVNTTLRSQLNGITFQMRDSNDARLADAPGAENLGSGQAILSANRYQQFFTFRPSDSEIRQALAAEAARDCGRPEWLFGYGETAVNNHVEQLPNPMQNGGDSVGGTIHQNMGGTTWDLGTNGSATSSNGNNNGNRGDRGDTHTEDMIVMAVKSILNSSDETQSPIQNLAMNQYRATLLALSAGYGVGATAELVIGYSNSRSKQIVRSVRELVQLPVAG